MYIYIYIYIYVYTATKIYFEIYTELKLFAKNII
jgi:hypothetical protein